MNVNGREIAVSNSGKVLFPGSGITKAELVEYYRRISPYMLPFIKDRPLVLRRFPDGIGKEGFYQKEASDYFPDWLARVEVPLKKGGRQHAVVADSAQTLVYLADQAMITPHAWLSTVHHLDKADRLIVDLDPSGTDFITVKMGAQYLRDIFHDYGYAPYVMTTGSRGLHVVAFLTRPRDFDRLREEAGRMAEELVSIDPVRFTTEHAKEKRGSRVFVDIARNAYGQTAVTPYAVRARPGAPVATPLNWPELDRKDLSPHSYTMKNIFRRLSHMDAP